MKKCYTSFKLFIGNHSFNDLSREDAHKIQEELEKFLMQLQNQVSIEFSSNGNPTMSKKEKYLFVSFDNKWVIDFQEDNISFAYNHYYPNDDYSYNQFIDDISIYITKLEDFLKLKSFRFGSVIESIILCTEDELKKFKEEDSIFQKSVRKIKKQKGDKIQEDLNIVIEYIYDTNLNLDLVHSPNPELIDNGYLLRIDVNTAGENRSARFDNDKIQNFLSDVIKNISGDA